jgi:hypothetical protein
MAMLLFCLAWMGKGLYSRYFARSGGTG